MSRITEKQMRIPALRAMSSRQGGFVTTTDLIAELRTVMQPSGYDLQPLSGRSDDYFSQRVRNTISHKSQRGNIIHEGYAEHDEQAKGVRITPAGRAFLSQIDAQQTFP